MELAEHTHRRAFFENASTFSFPLLFSCVSNIDYRLPDHRLRRQVPAIKGDETKCEGAKQMARTSRAGSIAGRNSLPHPPPLGTQKLTYTSIAWSISSLRLLLRGGHFGALSGSGQALPLGPPSLSLGLLAIGELI